MSKVDHADTSGANGKNISNSATILIPLAHVILPSKWMAQSHILSVFSCLKVTGYTSWLTCEIWTHEYTKYHCS